MIALERLTQVEELWARRNVLAKLMNDKRYEDFCSRRELFRVGIDPTQEPTGYKEVVRNLVKLEKPRGSLLAFALPVCAVAALGAAIVMVGPAELERLAQIPFHMQDASAATPDRVEAAAPKATTPIAWPDIRADLATKGIPVPKAHDEQAKPRLAQSQDAGLPGKRTDQSDVATKSDAHESGSGHSDSDAEKTSKASKSEAAHESKHHKSHGHSHHSSSASHSHGKKSRSHSG